MKYFQIKTFGWRNKFLDQISRIEEGFILNNCKIINNCNNNSSSLDFIYAHCQSSWEEAINYHKYCTKNAKLLLKVLDVPIHCLDFDKERTREKLRYANLILSNSKHVQKEIKEILGFDSIIVYDCIKDLEYKKEIKKEIDFLAIGRLNDPEKRGFLIKDLCKILREKRTLVTCGPEKLGISNELGIVDDSSLNSLYCASKFCLCLSRREGLYLPPLEAMVTGCIPIVCEDMTTVSEFIPKEFVCKPNIESIYNKILEIEKRYYDYQDVAINYGFIYKKFFDKKTVAKRIIDAYITII